MVTGSIHVRKNKWHMQIRFKDAEGKWQQTWKTTGLSEKGNKSKAKQLLRNWLDECSNAGGYAKPSKILFCDWVRDWVEMRKPELQATTYMSYTNMLTKHICPYFAKLKLQLGDITPIIIQQYHQAKGREGISGNTVIKQHAIMRSALQYAVKLKLRHDNPCDFVDKPKRKRFVSEFYNADEIKKLLEVSKGTKMEVPIFLAAFLGLRKSEVVGCRWSAINFMNKTLTVRHKVVRSIQNGKLINLATDDLKTESSYRILPLDERILEFLASVKKRQKRNMEICGDSYNTEYTDYICVDDMGVLLSPDYVTGSFPKLLKRHNLKKIRYHDLRHSCASLLLSLGYSMKEIQEWLGHSNYQTTANLYSHVDPRNKVVMIKGISDALK